MEEQWKAVVGYEGVYEVSNIGRVRSVDRYVFGKLGSKRFLKGEIRKLQKSHKGYMVVVLRNGQQPRSKQVHRLVAEAFIPNDADLPQVNHKDTNKENNCVSNLEWITGYDNMQHAIKNGCYKPFTDKQRKATMENLKKCQQARMKPVVQFDKDWNFISEYKSAEEASKNTGASSSKISLCCNGKRQTAGGFRWMYKERMR